MIFPGLDPCEKLSSHHCRCFPDIRNAKLPCENAELLIPQAVILSLSLHLNLAKNPT